MIKGIDCLSRLSQKDQINWCRNYVNHRERIDILEPTTIAEYLMDTHRSFHVFIYSAFNWSKTPEGHKYWYAIAKIK
jgi:hypothetical protein